MDESTALPAIAPISRSGQLKSWSSRLSAKDHEAAEAHRRLQRVYTERASIGGRVNDVPEADRLGLAEFLQFAEDAFDGVLSRLRSRIFQERIAASRLLPKGLGKAAAANFVQHVTHVLLHMLVDDTWPARAPRQARPCWKSLRAFPRFRVARSAPRSASVRRRIRGMRLPARRPLRPGFRSRRSGFPGLRPRRPRLR